MGGSLNANHLMFLGYGALWTIGLSLIGLLGGGIAGFIVALCRISPSRIVRLLSAGYVQLIQGTPLLVIMFLTYFGLPALGVTVSPLMAAGASLTIYRRCLSRRDLARLHRVRSEAAMGGGGRARSQPLPADDEGHPAASHPDRHAADRGLHGADHQEHLAGLGGRLRGTRAVRADHQQLPVRAIPDLHHHRRRSISPSAIRSRASATDWKCAAARPASNSRTA